VVALEWLGRGDRVSDVAFAVGYSDVSAFIAMFKAALGATPGQYFRGDRRRTGTNKHKREDSGGADPNLPPRHR